MKARGHISGDQMKKNHGMIIIRIWCMMLLVSAVFPGYVLADSGNNTAPLSGLSLSARTDRGYYPPGDNIRVLGSVTADSAPVNASVLFTFQGREKMVYTDEGSFLVSVPISGSDPEDMYPLEILARSPGFLDKKMSIPIIVMDNPSSLSPEPQVPDEFRE